MKSIRRLIPHATLPLIGVVRTYETYRLRSTRQSQKIAKTKFLILCFYKNEVTSMMNVGNT